jgi:hypothetical protein
MTASPNSEEELRRVLENGAKHCAGQLEKISGAAWDSAQFSTGETADGALDRMLDSSSGDRYGNLFSVPGGAFLIIIPCACGMRLTNRFTGGHAERIDTIEKRESVALAEIASITVNAFVTALAEALDEALLVSAPTSMVDCARDLLVRSIKKHLRPERLEVVCLVRLGSRALSSELSIILFLESETVARLKRR